MSAGRPLSSSLSPHATQSGGQPVPQAAAPLLQARKLDGRRGERLLFAGLELELAAGEVVWLRARNGRGKTTLLRLLAGLSSPAAGQIAVQGHAPRTLAGRRSQCYIGHNHALKDDLSALEALRFLASLSGSTPSAALCQSALARMGVAERARAPVRTLSQGQRKRVALARLALPQAAALWLLDEPFDALDDQGCEALNSLIAEHCAQGGAALLTSHQALSLREPLPREFSLDAFAPRKT